MTQEYVRICPVCETANPAAASVCGCGASLVGVDYVLKDAPRSEPAPVPAVPPAAASPICPYPDCAQPNPPGEARCLYCNRPLNGESSMDAASRESEHSPLPARLRAAWRLVEALPAQGAEADLLRVASLDGGEQRIVKRYRKGIRPDGELLARIAGAARPHVVQLFEYGEDGEGGYYELMEYCAHGSLRALLQAGPLPRERIRAIVREVGAAIAEIHARRILHRDLKPENILLRSVEPLDLVLSDFGTASLRDATVLFTGAAHTAKYAAPEALSGVLDEKSDWWALGMMTLEMASGRHPFAGLSEQVIHHRLATAPLDVRAVFDDALRRLCRGLLLRDPLRRWGRDEVARWLNDDPTLADPGDDLSPAGTLTPYRIGEAQCHDAAGLALALAKNWADALKDLRRGAIAAWLENQLHDHNLLRRLADIMDERGVSDDLRLLRFILAAAPGMPAVWRRQPLSPATLLAAARLARENNEAAKDWLESLAAEPVLETCIAAGKEEFRAVAAGWAGNWADFTAHWEAAHQAEETWRTTPKKRGWAADESAYLNFDEAVYARPLRVALPERRTRNAGLLLALFETDWLAALRARILAGMAEVAGFCPWYEGLGDPATLAPGALLAMEGLLPLAREDAAAERDRQGESSRARERALRLMRSRVATCLDNLNAIAEHGFSAANLDDLRHALHSFAETAAWALGQGGEGSDFQELKETIERLFRFAQRFEQALDRLDHVERVNAIFFQPYRLALGAAIIGFVGMTSPFAWPLGAVAGLFLVSRWRNAARERKRAGEAYARLAEQARGVLASY